VSRLVGCERDLKRSGSFKFVKQHSFRPIKALRSDADTAEKTKPRLGENARAGRGLHDPDPHMPSTQAHVVVDATRHLRGLFRNEPIFDGKESDRRLKMAAASGRLPRQHPQPYARGLFFFSCQLLANACVAASRVVS